MSFILETLGRGLLGRTVDAFEAQLPGSPDDGWVRLYQRHQQSPGSTDLALRLGFAFLHELHLADARSVFEPLLNTPGCRKIAALGMACVHDELGQLPQAHRALAVARREDPDDAAVLFTLGLVLERAGKPDEARRHYRRAVQVCPTLRNARERLAALAVVDRGWGSAAAEYEHLVELAPDDSANALLRGALLLENGDAEAAIDAFQQGLLVEPDVVAEPVEVACSVDQLAGSDEIQSAVAELETLVAKYPGASELHVQLGDLYVKTGEDRRAIAEYLAAIEIRPTFLEATIKLGTHHLRQQRLDDAALAFNRAVDLTDRLVTGFVGLGVAQRAAGRRADAEATFALAANLSPNSTLLLSEATRLQMKSVAQASVESPFGIDSEDVDENLQNGLHSHADALRRSPNDAAMHYRRSQLLRQMGAFDESVEALRMSVGINPMNPRAQVKLGVELWEAGHTAEAVSAFERAVRIEPGAIRTHYDLALTYSRNLVFEAAFESFVEERRGGIDERGLRDGIRLALQNAGVLDRATENWRAIQQLAERSSPLDGPRFSQRNN